jgi:hypothetical protein
VDVGVRASTSMMSAAGVAKGAPGKESFMADIKQTNYEQEDPDYAGEDEAIDRANRRLGDKLRAIDETEARIARNAGRDRDAGGRFEGGRDG